MNTNENVSGILRVTKRGTGELCDAANSLRPFSPSITVPPRMLREYDLSTGATLCGQTHNKGGSLELTKIESICGLTPADFKSRTPYKELIALNPEERFDLGITGNTSMRIIDLIAPIGKGTRGLIVSPPKAGKTLILEEMAKSIRATSPDTRVIVLLIDERPEEVTQFRRAVDAEIYASSIDQGLEEHIELAEMTLAMAQTELECGKDIAILVDSLTRMGRAFNAGDAGKSDMDRSGQGQRSNRSGGRRRDFSQNRSRGGGRIMSGGLMAGALEIPRRFFGLARNIENGGSVTIIATALVDTNSQMDEIIFQEFKGTGNSEIVLDRDLADKRIFPAINLRETGTRKEEELHGPKNYAKISLMRRALMDMGDRDAISALVKQVEKHKTNADFLDILPG